MPRFAANLTMLFTEHPFLERFAAAAQSGFGHVEFLFPYEHPANEVRAALHEAGLGQVLFNLPAGDWAAGDRGIAADPGRVDEFRAGVDRALEYAAILDCPRLNCLAGLRLEGVAHAVQWTTVTGIGLFFLARESLNLGNLAVETATPGAAPSVTGA